MISWNWIHQDSATWAAWAQGLGTVAAFLLAGVIYRWQIRQYRDQTAREVAQREADESIRIAEQAHHVSGWVQYPERCGTDEGDVSWVLQGAVLNRSNAPIWQVLAQAVDSAGQLLPLPPLFSPLLTPDEQWNLRWAAGWRVQPWEDTSTVSSAQMLPLPEVLARPGSLLRLRLTFLDAAGQAWQREASNLIRLPHSLPETPAGSIGLSRILDLVANPGRTGATPQSLTGGILGNLRQAIADEAAELLELPDRVRQSDDLARHLLYTRADWQWRPDYLNDVTITSLTGALHRFGCDPNDPNVQQRDQQLADPSQAYDQACAIIVAVGGLVRS
jgi:hypothetical protein